MLLRCRIIQFCSCATLVYFATQPIPCWFDAQRCSIRRFVHCFHSRLIPIITSNIQSKSREIRRQCCEFLNQVRGSLLCLHRIFLVFGRWALEHWGLRSLRKVRIDSEFVQVFAITGILIPSKLGSKTLSRSVNFITCNFEVQWARENK